MGIFCNKCEAVIENEAGRITVEIRPPSPTNEELTAFGHAVASGAPIPEFVEAIARRSLDFCIECAVDGGLTKTVSAMLVDEPVENSSALTQEEVDALLKADTKAIAVKDR